MKTTSASKLSGIIATTLALALVFAFTPIAAYGSVTAGSTAVGSANSGSNPSVLKAQAKKAKKAKTGWKKTKKGTFYYTKGVKAKGLKKIKGTYYYFNADGVLQKKDVKAGTVTFYINSKGKIFGAKLKSKYYYKTLKKMTSKDAYNFGTYIKARAVMSKICKKGDSKAKKRHKAFDWVVAQKYTHRHWYKLNHKSSKWIQHHARLILDGKGGDCHATSAAYAYMLAAMGYSPKIHLDAYDVISHCWVELKGKNYDPAFAKWNGDKGYFETKYTKYTPARTYKVPWFSAKHASKRAKVPAAFRKAGQIGLKSKGGALYWYENGTMVKDAWRTIEGKRYHFDSNGKAATRSAKIDGTYYVFDEYGALQTGASKAPRTVEIGGVTYQVSPDGKAASGWSADRTSYFGEDGAMLKGAWATIDGKKRYFGDNGKLQTGVLFVNSKFYATSADGTYLPELTQQLNAAAAEGTRATTLRRLLGTPNEQAYSASCNFSGDDGIWVYDNFTVTTARPSSVKGTVEEAIAAEDAGKPAPKTYETIAGVFAN